MGAALGAGLDWGRVARMEAGLGGVPGKGPTQNVGLAA